jgi:hypothetical protein
MDQFGSPIESMLVLLGVSDEISNFVMETAQCLARGPYSVTAAD